MMEFATSRSATEPLNPGCILSYHSRACNHKVLQQRKLHASDRGVLGRCDKPSPIGVSFFGDPNSGSFNIYIYIFNRHLQPSMQNLKGKGASENHQTTWWVWSGSQPVEAPSKIFYGKPNRNPFFGDMLLLYGCIDYQQMVRLFSSCCMPSKIMSLFAHQRTGRQAICHRLHEEPTTVAAGKPPRSR